MNYYYKKATDQNCVARASALLFEDLGATDVVSGQFLTDNAAFVNLHNHMKSSLSWKSVSQWDTGVEYTIRHPVRDIIVSDTNRGQKTLVYRQEVISAVRGTTANQDRRDFTIRRVRREELDCKSRTYHDSEYTWVKIKSEKTFVYESPRSSWNFHLAVVWEGETKTQAESSQRQYLVTVSMGSVDKASADAMYTTASFMEKIMDALFQKSTRRHIILSLD